MDNKLHWYEIKKKLSATINYVAKILYNKFPSNELVEPMVPAYTEGNFLSRWVFWKRLNFIFKSIKNSNGAACLDFGCGLGLTIPILKNNYDFVYGVDVVNNITSVFIEEWYKDHQNEKDNIKLAKSIDEANIPNESLDLIIALDVLEHIEELEEMLIRMKSLLKPGGIILISGPTENWIYKLGRWVAGFGKHYEGNIDVVPYHTHDIYDIEEQLVKHFETKRVKRIFPIFNLFIFLKAVK